MVIHHPQRQLFSTGVPSQGHKPCSGRLGSGLGSWLVSYMLPPFTRKIPWIWKISSTFFLLGPAKGCQFLFWGGASLNVSAMMPAFITFAVLSTLCSVHCALDTNQKIPEVLCAMCHSILDIPRQIILCLRQICSHKKNNMTVWHYKRADLVDRRLAFFHSNDHPFLPVVLGIQAMLDWHHRSDATGAPPRCLNLNRCGRTRVEQVNEPKEEMRRVENRKQHKNKIILHMFRKGSNHEKLCRLTDISEKNIMPPK